jgi:hypothetical protein
MFRGEYFNLRLRKRQHVEHNYTMMNFLIFTLSLMLLGDEIRYDDMNWTRSMHGRNEQIL